MSNNNQTSKDSKLLAYELGAIGIVFGDIGTSPLYAFKECLKPFTQGSGPSTDIIIGICSLIMWSLLMVVSLKYVFFVMRADNHGEGGILSLMTLANTSAPAKAKYILLLLGLAGAATFYGDSVITPAISVLSAVEGLEIVNASFKQYVIPISLVILFALFKIQRKGTQSVGALFGPIMVCWFLALGGLGLYHIAQNMQILKAVSPLYAADFILNNKALAFTIAGAVFLTVTGGEALYADMGHFGVKPIKRSWFVLVFPCLVLNYFGQGAMLLNNPKLVSNPFYELANGSHFGLIVLVLLATCATVIASQAVISGAYSMTMQAIQLGYLPRLHIMHTCEQEKGQIYIPLINWGLFIAVSWLLFAFKNSDSLASAYGIAVVTTMLITTLLLGFVIVYQWKWNPVISLIGICIFLMVDVLFFATNVVKIEDGGWVPLTIAAGLFTMLTTWKTGKSVVSDIIKETAIDLQSAVDMFSTDSSIHVTQGTAVFLSGMPDIVPVAFMHNLKHNHVRHETNIFLTFNTVEKPYCDKDVSVTEMAQGFYKIVCNIGFMQRPDVPKTIADICAKNLIPTWKYDPMTCSFFLTRETIVSTPRYSMMRFREHLFVWMTKNSTKAAAYFNIPANRVVELGTQIDI